MKVAAKPMGLPSSSLVTEKKLKKTEAGRKALELVQEAMQNGFMPYKSPKEFLKAWNWEKLDGTCAGQACAAIVTKGRHPDKSEKSQIKKANLVESIAYHILHNMALCVKYYSSKDKLILIKESEKKAAKANLQSIQSKMKKLAKKKKKHHVAKKIKELKKEKKECEKSKDNPIKSANKRFEKIWPASHVNIPSSEEERLKLKKFAKKMRQEYWAQIEKDANVQFVAHEEFSNAKKFYGRIKELLHEKSPASVIVGFNPKKGGTGHAVALFIGKHSTIYDSLAGITKPLKIDNFKKVIRDTFVSEKSGYQARKGKLEFRVDIYKQK